MADSSPYSGSFADAQAAAQAGTRIRWQDVFDLRADTFTDKAFLQQYSRVMQRIEAHPLGQEMFRAMVTDTKRQSRTQIRMGGAGVMNTTATAGYNHLRDWLYVSPQGVRELTEHPTWSQYFTSKTNPDPDIPLMLTMFHDGDHMVKEWAMRPKDRVPPNPQHPFDAWKQLSCAEHSAMGNFANRFRKEQGIPLRTEYYLGLVDIIERINGADDKLAQARTEIAQLPRRAAIERSCKAGMKPNGEYDPDVFKASTNPDYSWKDALRDAAVMKGVILDRTQISEAALGDVPKKYLENGVQRPNPEGMIEP